MKLRVLTISAIFMVAVVALAAAPSVSRSDMVVHEWGTFLAMNSSEGIALDGMYHEEHALPAFVHARSKDQLRLRSVSVKGETPVIYFYTDKPQQVQVQVGFPGGIWTQWYPQASTIGPSLVQAGSLPRVRNGYISWQLDVVPDASAKAQLPATSSDALWNHAREVDAAYVRSRDRTQAGQPSEWERFVFYRGLGDAPLPLVVNAAAGGRIACHSSLPEGVRHVYVLRVEADRAAYRYVPSVSCDKGLDGVVPEMETSLSLEQFVSQISDDLAGRLVESGLFEKEARAMVNTWRSSYFKTDGIRVLFVLPQSWTDRYIPLKMVPEPREIVRVMVGRMELLTPERERQAELAIRDLASPVSSVREKAFETLRAEGRYVEPILRHTLNTSTNERVRALCRRLLVTDFVTEIRATLNDPANGEKLSNNQVFARAQLASLLREIGLDAEAKQEGEAALLALQQMPKPTMSNHESRNTFRAFARAHEGAGHDAEALKWYGDFVTFGSGVERCGGCHNAEGPRDPSFFRDWWAGRKFAQYAQATGQTTTLIQEREAALAGNRQNLAAQLGLAYLYEGRGDAAKAQALWAQIIRPGIVY